MTTAISLQYFYLFLIHHGYTIYCKCSFSSSSPTVHFSFWCIVCIIWFLCVFSFSFVSFFSLSISHCFTFPYAGSLISGPWWISFFDWENNFLTPCLSTHSRPGFCLGLSHFCERAEKIKIQNKQHKMNKRRLVDSHFLIYLLYLQIRGTASTWNGIRPALTPDYLFYF